MPVVGGQTYVVIRQAFETYGVSDNRKREYFFPLKMTKIPTQ